MRLIHLSDLHFGALAEATVTPLLQTLDDLDPDLVVISGDLTQRARTRQFKLAREFLRQLPSPNWIAVPGNHDVPLWDLLRRMLLPRRRFDRYVCADPFPSYRNDQLCVVGVNTARSLTIKNGRINQQQLMEVERRLEDCPEHMLRVVVAHHPFVVPEDEPLRDRVGRSEMALPVFLRMGVDLLLTGHRHHSWISHPHPGLVALHAGTATSSRVRHEQNAFNEILVETGSVVIRRFTWQPESGSFSPPEPKRSTVYRRQGGRLETEDQEGG